MLELFLKLIDRLIELTRVQGRREAKTFEALVEPVFADLTTVHQTYLDAFTKCLALLERPESTTGEAARELLSEATRCEASRRRIVVLGKELSTHCDQAPMREFFDSVCAYFSRSGVKFTTHFSEAIALTEHASKPVVVEAVNVALTHIRTHWEAVCRTYARAAGAAAKGAV